MEDMGRFTEVLPERADLSDVVSCSWPRSDMIPYFVCTHSFLDHASKSYHVALLSDGKP